MSQYRTSTAHDGDSRGTSVIVPTYNERANVVPIVRSCRRALTNGDSEVLVVDDDSPDGTWKVGQRAFEDVDDVRVVRRTGDRGLGKSVVDGFDLARNDHLAVIDADFQHPPERLPDLVEALADADADVAVGSRYLERSGIEGWSQRRKVISHGATTVTRAVLPEASGLSDPLSGFFAVRRELVDGAALDPTGYKILLEILTECPVDRVVEVPFTFTERAQGTSKATPKEYAKFLNHLASCSYRARAAEFDSAVGRVSLGAILHR